TAQVELAAGGSWITRLHAGSFVPEGLLAKENAFLRAETACDACRIRQVDLLVAAGSTPACRHWYDRCRVLEQEVRKLISLRVAGARSVLKQSMSQDLSLTASSVHSFGSFRKSSSSSSLSLSPNSKARASSAGSLPVLKVELGHLPGARAFSFGQTRVFRDSPPGDLLAYTLPKTKPKALAEDWKDEST
ncbi:unnamed protein product, partial [Polarella glacialis]